VITCIEESPCRRDRAQGYDLCNDRKRYLVSIQQKARGAYRTSYTIRNNTITSSFVRSGPRPNITSFAEANLAPSPYQILGGLSGYSPARRVEAALRQKSTPHFVSSAHPQRDQPAPARRWYIRRCNVSSGACFQASLLPVISSTEPSSLSPNTAPPRLHSRSCTLQVHSFFTASHA